MAKSARATSVKKRRQTLKRNVFGPVEDARNERLSAKLLELASKPKIRAEMEVEQNDSNPTSTTTNSSEEAKEEQATQDVDMDASNSSSSKPTKPAEGRSNRSVQRQKAAKVAKVEKKRVRRPRNMIAFKQHPMKAKQAKKR